MSLFILYTRNVSNSQLKEKLISAELFLPREIMVLHQETIWVTWAKRKRSDFGMKLLGMKKLNV
jgi:hypothetical protein